MSRWVTFAGPLLAERERAAWTHVTRGAALAGLLLVVWLARPDARFDAPGGQMVADVLRFDAVVAGLMAVAAGVAAFGETGAGRRDALRLADGSGGRVAANAMAAPLTGVGLMLAMQLPLLLFLRTLGGVSGGEVAGSAFVAAGWVTLCGTAGAWAGAAIGQPLAAQAFAVGGLVLVGVKADLAAEILPGGNAPPAVLVPWGVGAGRLPTAGQGAVYLVVWGAASAAMLWAAGRSTTRPQEQRADAAERAYSRPSPTPDRSGRRQPPKTAIDRPPLRGCPHAWKGRSIVALGGYGLVARAAALVLATLAFAVLYGHLRGSVARVSAFAFWLDAAALSARRVSLEREVGSDALRLLPGGGRAAADGLRSGCVRPLLLYAFVWTGTIGFGLLLTGPWSPGDTVRAAAYVLETLATAGFASRSAGLLALRFSSAQAVAFTVVGVYGFWVACGLLLSPGSEFLRLCTTLASYVGLSLLGPEDPFFRRLIFGAGDLRGGERR